MQVIAAVAQGLERHVAPGKRDRHGAHLAVGGLGPPAEHERHGRIARGERQCQHPARHRHERTAARRHAREHARGVHRAAERGRHGEEHHRAPHEMRLAAEGDERHGRAEHELHRAVCQPPAAGQDHERRVQRADERRERVPPAAQHHAAHARRCQHQAVVDQQIQPKQAVEIDDVHGGILARRAREIAQKRPAGKPDRKSMHRRGRKCRRTLLLRNPAGIMLRDFGKSARASTACV